MIQTITLQRLIDEASLALTGIIKNNFDANVACFWHDAGKIKIISEYRLRLRGFEDHGIFGCVVTIDTDFTKPKPTKHDSSGTPLTWGYEDAQTLGEYTDEEGLPFLSKSGFGIDDDEICEALAADSDWQNSPYSSWQQYAQATIIKNAMAQLSFDDKSLWFEALLRQNEANSHRYR